MHKILTAEASTPLTFIDFRGHTRREAPDAAVNGSNSCLFLSVIMLWYGHSSPMYIERKPWAIFHVLFAGSYNFVHKEVSQTS